QEARRFARRAIVPSPAPVELADEDVVERREAGKGTDVLERTRDPVGADAMRRQASDLRVPDADPTPVGPDGTADPVDEGGLDGAVRPHHAEDGAGRHFEADIPDRPDPREGLGDAFQGEERPIGLGGSVPPPRVPSKRQCQRFENGGAGYASSFVANSL